MKRNQIFKIIGMTLGVIILLVVSFYLQTEAHKFMHTVIASDLPTLAPTDPGNYATKNPDQWATHYAALTGQPNPTSTREPPSKPATATPTPQIIYWTRTPTPTSNPYPIDETLTPPRWWAWLAEWLGLQWR